MPRNPIAKGQNKGIKYEQKINNILKEKDLQLPSTQSAGASDAPDGYFWYKGERYPIEIKKPSADFAQVELSWTGVKGFFYSEASKNRDFVEFLKESSQFLQTINKNWISIPRKFTKKSLKTEDRNWDLDHFQDIKKSINVSFIEKFYNFKIPPVNYIQIQKRGFYYLGKDIAGLSVPRLNGKPYLRARVKTRSTSKNRYGFLVAIKMPGINPSTHSVEELDGRIFPIPEKQAHMPNQKKINGFI